MAVPNYSRQAKEPIMSSKSIYNTCLNCCKETKNKKFCSRSCSASFNNKGVRRNGNQPTDCQQCGKKTKLSKRKFCSRACFGESVKVLRTEEERKKLQAFYFMSYYTKKKNQTPKDADLNKIKKIYLNCPEGYEVDHIIPISKGGLHHQDNLQYLTITENRKKGAKLNWKV